MDEQFNEQEAGVESFDSAFEHADETREQGYYLPPEGKYTGVIAEGKGKLWIEGDPKAGRVRFALKVLEGTEKGRWVWADIDTRKPDSKNCPSQKAADMRISLLSRSAKAFANSAADSVTFSDKGSWTTADLTEYAEAVIKAHATTQVKFSVKHRVKKDGTPDLITKGKNEGHQRYQVYINGAA